MTDQGPYRTPAEKTDAKVVPSRPCYGSRAEEVESLLTADQAEPQRVEIESLALLLIHRTWHDKWCREERYSGDWGYMLKEIWKLGGLCFLLFWTLPSRSFKEHGEVSLNVWNLEKSEWCQILADFSRVPIKESHKLGEFEGERERMLRIAITITVKS